MTGLYLPGHSPVHRAPAGLKLLLLVVAGSALVWLHAPLAAGTGVIVAIALFGLAGFGPRVLWSQVRPVLPTLLLVGVAQGLLADWRQAAVSVGGLLVLVLLAALVTLTTRATDLVAVAVRLLSLVGLDGERLGLLLALGIRSVPVVVGLAREVREAQLARGLGSSPRAFAVPLVVRSLRHADALGEALVARGLDD